MAREKYLPRDNAWVAYTEFDRQQVAQDIYQQAGGTFPIKWDGADPVVDFNELPVGVSENDAKQAVRDNHPHR